MDPHCRGRAMNDPHDLDAWRARNQRDLMAAIEPLRRALALVAGAGDHAEPLEPDAGNAEAPAPAALEHVVAAFGLSAFERGVLLLCAGVELSSSFAELTARAEGDPRKVLPTWSLALAVLPDAHWSALAAGAPLRRHLLIEVREGDLRTASPLRIDECVL